MQQRHRFRRGRRLVEQRGVRHLHPRQVRHHRLEIQERLEAALRDLGLVGRVGRVPARVLHHHAQDHARRDRVVVAEADVGAERLVAAGNLRQPAQVLVFAFGGRQRQRLRAAGSRRGWLRRSARRATRAPIACEHRVALGGRWSDVAGREPVVGIERVHYPSRPWYCALSSSPPPSPAPDTWTLIIQVACGSLLTASG